MRAIGFMQGQMGDVCMSTVAARSFKEQHHGSTLTLGLGPQYAEMAPLFARHPYFDDVHVYTTYDGWPGSEDLAYLQRAQYDAVFHAMPPHRDQEWWKLRHQYAETVHMCGLPIPTDITPTLTRWFKTLDLSNTVAIAPFGGNGSVNDKVLPVDFAQAITDYLIQRGFNVLHLGAVGEPELYGAVNRGTSYFDSVKAMLGCRALIHCDTGLGHVAGAYNHPSLGLYASRYYGPDLIRHIQPLHSNFRSIAADRITDIELDTVRKSIDDMLG